MGEVFAGRYELVDLLGSGGMGTVWRVWDRRVGAYRAAKVLRQSDAASLLRFVREQSFRISHPHVVTPLGWAGEDERVLFTMPLLRGGSVASLLGDFGGLPPAWTATLLDQLLDALGAVHAAGLLHRDLKPGNLLLEPTGRGRPHLRLSDFGIALPLDEPRMTRASQVLGTAGYVAPEQLRGADPDPRQDLYGVGVLTAQMLTGRPPPVSGSPVPSPRPGSPTRLWDLVARLAAVDPTDRPDNAVMARAELAATDLVPAGGEAPVDGDEDVEVLDHLPVLPPGWTPGGPLGRAAVAPSEAQPSASDPSVSTSPLGHRLGPAAERPAVPRRTLSPTRWLDPSRRRRAVVSLAWLAAVATLASVAVFAATALPGPGTPSPDLDESDRPAVTDGTPMTRSPGRGAGRTSPPASIDPPAAGTAVRAGEECSFADVAVRERTAEGRLVTCTRTAGGDYVWTPG